MEKKLSFYFDNAATTFPKSQEVYDFMVSFYRQHGGNAGRGQYKLAGEAARLTAETRNQVKTILQAENKDLIFTPSATIALNMVIQGILRRTDFCEKECGQGKNLLVRENEREWRKLGTGGFLQTKKTVYISPFEHNSVTRVLHHFEKLGVVSVQELFVSADFEYDIEKIKAQFEAKKPDLVIVSHASNVIGLIAPVLEIFALAKRAGALTVCDMAQTAGLVPLNAGSELVDFAIFAGHKTLYGPFGIGGFVKSKNVLLEPILFGGTGLESANQDMPESLPGRFEMGSQNICAIAGLHAATKWFLRNAEEIRSVEKKNHQKLLEILGNYDFVKILGPENRFGKETECIGVVSTVFDGYASEDIANVFDEKEIAVRAGLQCSPVAHKFLGTFPAGTVRFSVSYFTGEREFGELEKAMEYVAENR